MAAIHDHERLKECISQKNNEFFNLAVDTMEKGLRSHSYQLRAMLLQKIHPPDNNLRQQRNILIDCNMNVGALASTLLNSEPSFQETKVCTGTCEPAYQKLRTVQLEPWMLLRDFENIVQNHIEMKGSRPCRKEGCGGTKTTTISSLGENMSVDVSDIIRV